MADMQLNFAAAMVVLLAGLCVLVMVSLRSESKTSRLRLYLAALFAGPMIAVAFWALEVFVLNPEMYPTAFAGDALATLGSTVLLGTFVGVTTACLMAVVFWTARPSKDVDSRIEDPSKVKPGADRISS